MFKEEGYKLMGAAFEVYNELGYGMAEEIYQQSLEIELGIREIPFLTKQELDVFYKGRKLTTSTNRICWCLLASSSNSRRSRK